MKKFFMSLSLRNTMIIIVSLATIVISYYNIRDFTTSLKIERDKTALKELVILSKSLSALIHETQKERGASAGYLGSGGKKFKSFLPKQRELTDKRISEYKKTLSEMDIRKYDPQLQKYVEKLNSYLQKLSQIRNKVNAFKISLKEEVKWYTAMNTVILQMIGLTSRLAPNEKIAMDLAAYVSFLKAKERAGIERAVLSATFGADKFKPGMFVKFIRLISEQNAYLDDFLTFASPEMKKMYLNAIKDPSFAEVQKMRDIALKKAKTGHFNVDAEYWFATITKKINILKKIDDNIADIIINDLNKISNHYILQTVVGIVINLLMIFIGFVSVRKLEMQLRSLKGLILKIAENKDISLEIRVYEKDEFGTIRMALKEFLSVLHEVMTSAFRNSNENKVAAIKLKEAFRSINENIQKEAQIVTEAAITADNLKENLLEESHTSNIIKNSIETANESLKNAMTLMDSTMENIQNNAQNENELADKLQRLAHNAQEVKNVLTVISEIADQTNLLALNAAIEAARAGEHGRGFAVVADEVRKLAERTQKSLGEIDATINVIVQAIETANDEMHKNIQNVQIVTDQTREVQEKISDVSEEMGDVVFKVQANVDKIDKIVKIMQDFIEKMETVKRMSNENKNSVSQNYKNVEKIATLAEVLLKEISQFKL